MADSPLGPGGIKDIAKMAGPTLAGSIINWYLYGVLTVQYLLYLLYSRNDRITIKIIVHFIFLIDTIQTLFTMDDLFFRFVYNFGDVNKVYQFHWVFSINSLDATIALVVQLVYCWRIWVLSGWRIIPITSGAIALLANISGFITGIQFQLGRDVPGVESQVPLMLWLFGSAVVDVVVASAMVFILLRAKKRTQGVHSSTGEKILSILTLTLETNAVTAAAAIETIIVVFIKSLEPPVTNFYEIGGFLLGKLYSNCFMILLNQRHQYSPASRAAPTLDSALHQQGSLVDNLEFGPRPSGNPPESTFLKNDELHNGDGYHSNVSFGSFQIPGINVRKTVTTM